MDTVNEQHIRTFRIYDLIKRGADILLALVLLAALLPLLCIVWVLIKLTSPGPALFRQERVGRNGRIFRIAKFRTMIVGAEKKGPLVTAADDCRITKIGAILRATKIDELPQLWNVLVGDMSFVGPRPQVVRYVDMFNERMKLAILAVRPGITGPTAIQFRHEETILENRHDRERFYVEVLLVIKCEIDFAYVCTRGFASDSSAFFRTVGILCAGIYHRLLKRPIGQKLDLSPRHRQMIEDYDGEPVEFTDTSIPKTEKFDLPVAESAVVKQIDKSVKVEAPAASARG